MKNAINSFLLHNLACTYNYVFTKIHFSSYPGRKQSDKWTATAAAACGGGVNITQIRAAEHAASLQKYCGFSVSFPAAAAGVQNKNVSTVECIGHG